MTYWSEIRERGILEATAMVYLFQLLDIIMTSTIEPSQEANALMAYVWTEIGFWCVIAFKLSGALMVPLSLWLYRYIRHQPIQNLFSTLLKVLSIGGSAAPCVWNLYVMLS